MICFLDLDGVLVDFLAGACRLFNVDQEELFKRWPPGDFDCAIPIAGDPTSFWERIMDDDGFWDGLPEMSDAREILGIVEGKYGRGNIYLLTAPTSDPHSYCGKAEWVAEHLPEYHGRLHIGQHKHLCAGPGRMLVDDRDDNVDKFIRFGGWATLVPRRWNRGWKGLESGTAVEFLSAQL